MEESTFHQAAFQQRRVQRQVVPPGATDGFTTNNTEGLKQQQQPQAMDDKFPSGGVATMQTDGESVTITTTSTAGLPRDVNAGPVMASASACPEEVLSKFHHRLPPAQRPVSNVPITNGNEAEGRSVIEEATDSEEDSTAILKTQSASAAVVEVQDQGDHGSELAGNIYEAGGGGAEEAE